MTAMAKEIRVKPLTKFDPGHAFEAAVRRYARSQGLVGKRLARMLGIEPVTATRRLSDDPLERREMRVSELGRLIAADARSFFDEVWRPTFETPDHELESKIHDLREELARRRAARAAGVAGRPELGREPGGER